MLDMMDVGHNQNDSNNLTSHVVELATSGRKVHYLKATFGQGSVVPVIALHGLGGYVSSLRQRGHRRSSTMRKMLS